MSMRKLALLFAAKMSTSGILAIQIFYLKITLRSPAWWYRPINSSTQEVEAGEW
jgi:hypothetical protein